MARVLIIDDDPDFCHGLSRIVGRMGHEAIACGALAEGVAAAQTRVVDAIFLDVGLPDGSGLSLLSQVDQLPSRPVVVIITGAGDPDGAQLAITSGAWDYIEKGTSSKHIALALKRALDYRRHHQPTDGPPAKVSLRRSAIIGNSPQINACLDTVAHCAAIDINVLITGETGTGKELFARAIHANSARAEGPFVVVDCTALPETLVESLLFGYSRGAFTGAEEDKQGLVIQADQGTLLLDEVGELPPALQKAFLRVLEERRVRPLGGRQEVASDFRLLAATHRNLEQMVARGAFRSDLFFRIQSVGITLPALRERTADIRSNATHHLQELCRRLQLEQKGISEAFFETLEAYRWPGNVRELVNALEQAVLMARHDPTLYPVHLPGKIRVEVAQAALFTPCAHSAETGVFQPNASRGHTLQEFREMACAHAEEQYLKDVLTACRGDVKQALHISGLSQSRLYALLKKYHLTPARQKDVGS